MGSSTSKKVSTSNSNSNSESNVKVTTVAANENSLIEEEKLLELAEEAKTSIDEDGSLPNVLSHFARLLPEPSLHCFEELVSASKENWANLLRSLKGFAATGDIGAEQVQEMEDIYDDYWSLLLQTRLGIAILVKKCVLQRSNVSILLEIIQECQSNDGELSKDDKIARRECIEELGAWLTTDELDTLMNKWAIMQGRLRSQQKKWEETYRLVSAKKRKQMYGYIALAVAGIALVAVSVTLIVLTCGGATPVVVAAGASVAAPVATALTALEVTAIVVAGVGCAVGGAVGAHSAYKVLKDAHDTNKRKKEILSVVVRVQSLLAKMLKSSKVIQVKVNEAKCKSKMDADYETFKKVQSLRKMKASLIIINRYLEEFITQGQAVIVTVDEACQEMINC